KPAGQDAHKQEYPVVLMQCRGDDTPGHPVEPSTCWTQYAEHRIAQTSRTLFPPWRMDRYASAADREPHIGYPDPLPDGCLQDPDHPDAHTVHKPDLLNKVDRFVPFVSADEHHTMYHPIPDAAGTCGQSLAPEMVIVADDDGPPPNTTFAVS